MLWWTIHQLKSRDARTRLGAVKSLADRVDASLAPHLIEALSDSSPQVRKEAAAALAQFPEDEQVVSNLIGRLHDSDPEVKQSAIEALREIRNPRTIEALVPLLRDAAHQVRWRAANALDALGWQPTDDTQFAFRAAALDKLELAASVGPAALDVLVGMLKDRSFPGRHAVVEALSKIGDARVVRPLESATQDEDSLVRKAAIDALSHTGDARVVETLLRMLNDRESKVRAAAVEALGQIGDVRALEAISALVGDANWDVRILSVQALGRLRDKRACEPLVAALRDRDHDVRQAAAESLGLLQDRRAIQPLVTSLKDESSSVRQAVSLALRRIDRQWEKSEAAQLAMPELKGALSDKEYWVRQAAADALAKIGDQRRAEPESTGFADAVQRKRNMATAALSAILKDQDEMLRKAAADALGRQGDARGVDALLPALRDESEWVAEAAATALSCLNWNDEDSAADRARQLVLLQEWDQAAAMGPSAIEPLVETLQCSQSFRREAAARALGSLEGRDVVAALVEALSDGYRPVRRAAATSLRRLNWSPETREQEAQLSIELGEWNALPALGTAAVSPLLRVLEDCAGDLETLSVCVSTLSQLIQNQAEQWTTEHLELVLTLKEGLPVPTGAESGQAPEQDDPLAFDCLMLVQLAERELTERSVTT